MNALPPGWNPDPTGRHEYRYWDGGRWTDDVSDNGVTGVDAMASDQTWTQHPPADPTAPYPPAAPYPPMTQGPPTTPYSPYSTGPYPPADTRDPTATWGAGPPATPYPPGPAGPSGAYPPPTGRSGPSAGLLVGLAALAVAVIGGIAYLLIHDDGDDTATQQTSQTETTETTEAPDDGGSDITLPDPGDDPTTVPDDGGGDQGSDSGGTSDDENEVFVDTVADALESTGIYTREQAECAAQVMLDQLGVERMSNMDPSDPFSDLTPEETQDLITSIADCGFTMPESGGST
jgi:Protein of unknown function (DUF2510)